MLPHPKTGHLVRFAVNSKDKEVQEIQYAKGEPSSWFINDRVKQDGGLYITTAIDPLFLLISQLDLVRKKKTEKDAGVFVDDLEIFSRADCPAFKLLKDVKHCDLSLICDSKKIGEETYFKLNDEKVLSWLQRKVDSICTFISQMDDPLSMIRAQVHGFKSSTVEKITTEQLIGVAIGLLSEYLPHTWMIKLQEAYCIKGSIDSALYSSDFATAHDNEKKKRKAEEELEEEKPAKKRKTVAQAKLDKVNKKGMKHMTSFFPSSKK